VTKKRKIAIRSIPESSSIAMKRFRTGGSVAGSGCVAKQCLITVGSVTTKLCIVKQRLIAGSSVKIAGCIVVQCVKAYCRVVDASGQAEERILAFGSVIIRIATIRRRIHGETSTG